MIIGKQLYLQSKNLDSYKDIGTVVELVIPIQKYWVIEEALEKANYLLASEEPNAEIIDSYRNIFGLCAPFAVREKERMWLYERARDK